MHLCPWACHCIATNRCTLIFIPVFSLPPPSLCLNFFGSQMFSLNNLLFPWIVCLLLHLTHSSQPSLTKNLASEKYLRIFRLRVFAALRHLTVKPAGRSNLHKKIHIFLGDKYFLGNSKNYAIEFR